MAFPATYQDIQNAVIAKLRLDATADLARVKQWINEVYAQVALETRGLQTTRTDVLTAGTSSYTLNAAVLEIELLTYTQVGGNAWFPLEQASLDVILNLRAVSPGATGAPRKYALVLPGTLEVWPTPADAGTLKTWYVYSPTALSANGDLPAYPEPYASKLLEFGACIQGAEYKRDLLMLGEFQQQYASWLQAFQRYLNRKAGSYPESFPTWQTRVYAFSDPSVDVPDYA